MSHLDLTALAAKAALDDAGLKLSDVDGLFASNLQNVFAPLNVGEYLGIRPKVTEGTQIGGSSPVAHLLWAALALDAGLIDVALVCYGSNQRTAAGRLHLALDRRAADLRAALRPALSDQLLCPGDLAPHVRVRHDARAARRHRRRRARLGAEEPGRLHARSADRSRTCWQAAWCAIRSPCATAAW